MLEMIANIIHHRFVTCLNLDKETINLLHLRLAWKKQEDQLPTLPSHVSRENYYQKHGTLLQICNNCVVVAGYRSSTS